jgi:hypothetical protein
MFWTSNQALATVLQFSASAGACYIIPGAAIGQLLARLYVTLMNWGLVATSLSWYVLRINIKDSRYAVNNTPY